MYLTTKYLSIYLFNSDKAVNNPMCEVFPTVVSCTVHTIGMYILVLQSTVAKPLY